MRPIEFFRPQPGLDLQRPYNLGRVYYVDNDLTGMYSDSNEGTDPNHPLETIQAGIDLCANNQGDYVFVLDCYNADTYPIEVNSPCMHLIGMSTPVNWGWTVLASGAADVFEISSPRVELAGFSIFSTGAYYGVDLQNCLGYWIHHMNFAVSQLQLGYGIGHTTGSPSEGLIEDNQFGKLVTQITVNGINGNLTSTNIRNNYFRQVDEICINLNVANIGCIIGNYFAEKIAHTPQKGWAITLGSGCSGGLIANNFASTSGDNTGERPYLDNSSGDDSTLLNAWAGNIWGCSIVEPLYLSE